MRAVLQRVSEASVEVDSKTVASIKHGLVVLLGIEDEDTSDDISWLTRKIANLRIFPDEENHMNISLTDSGGEIIVVSQFTLHASTKKGNRPSFIKAAKPDTAVQLYQQFVQRLEKELDGKVQTGIFGAMMNVSLVNDGPVTLVIDTKNKE
ncbi:D-aminoacyl-tRNA deacylase [Luteirhabdus pelagi]|uniref:D-aminoacyl-tRNA deacylase n=1 Tax=Luteirhabdus pelagi TaxID=2792783 RepID=UPI00193A605C|nr:D-aminoacyl-tRNA deacylase [Luteirhabdus pelagi]